MTPDEFWSKGERRGHCLIWTGRDRVGPYGSVYFGGRRWLVHRLAYHLAVAPVQTGIGVVRHRCDTPLCFEPECLVMGTTRDNIDDKVAKRRHRFGSAHPMAKLTDQQVEEIRHLNREGAMQKDLAQKFNVSTTQISRLVRGLQRKGD